MLRNSNAEVKAQTEQNEKKDSQKTESSLTRQMIEGARDSNTLEETLNKLGKEKTDRATKDTKAMGDRLEDTDHIVEKLRNQSGANVQTAAEVRSKQQVFDRKATEEARAHNRMADNTANSIAAGITLGAAPEAKTADKTAARTKTVETGTQTSAKAIETAHIDTNAQTKGGKPAEEAPAPASQTAKQEKQPPPEEQAKLEQQGNA